MASDTEHELRAGQLIMSCCLSSPISTDCLIRKKKNQFPFCWCAIASGANHLRTSQLSATALENGFGTKCEEHLFSSNYDYSTLTWPETYLTSIKNSTGSVITTNSSPSLTKSPRRAVRRETKDDEFPPWEEAGSVCPVLPPIPWFSWHPKQPL